MKKHSQTLTAITAKIVGLSPAQSKFLDSLGGSRVVTSILIDAANKLAVVEGLEARDGPIQNREQTN